MAATVKNTFIEAREEALADTFDLAANGLSKIIIEGEMGNIAGVLSEGTTHNRWEQIAHAEACETVDDCLIEMMAQLRESATPAA